jgi:hypothetical protein
MEQSGPGFAHDIRPLFRTRDVEFMKRFFDLSSYEEVRAHAEAIYDRVSSGSMPCDGAWPSERVERFREWMDAGTPP